MFQSAVIHAEYTFTNHNAVINAVCYNRHQDCFVSSDDTCLRLWSPLKGELRRVELPPRTSYFIQAIEYIESRQVYVAAALDGTLKLYDSNLSELASIFTGRAAILSLVYDATHNRLLSGGVDGCAAWRVRGRPLSVAEHGVNPHYELSPLPTFFSNGSHPPSSSDASSSSNAPNTERSSATGATIGFLPAAPKPWVHSSPEKRKANRKSAATTTTETQVPHRRPWVQKLQLSADCSRLFAQSHACIDVFSTVDGQNLETYSALIPAECGAILAFVVHEPTQYVVCGCLNGWLFVVSLHPVAVVHVFKDHTLRVTGLAVLATSHLVLSSSLDGTVRLWDLDARRQAHRLDVGQPVHAITILGLHGHPSRFACRLRSAIQLYRIQSTIKEHLPAHSPICVLQRVLPPPMAHGAIVSDDDDNGGSLDDDSVTDSVEGTNDSQRRLQQVIVAAGMDKTIRLFAGCAANEAPSFTWIPDEAALDVIGFALHPVAQHLFLLLETQKIVVVDVQARLGDKDTSAIVRTVDLAPRNSALGGGGASRPSGRVAAATSSSRDVTNGGGTNSRRSHPAAAANTNNSNSSSNSAPRGRVTCLCVCYYPPIFRSTTTTAAATAHVTPAAQSKWFSRTFVNRRQPSAVANELKRRDEPHAAETNSSDISSSPISTTRCRRNALVQSEHEWIVCGSEFGHLLFWHTGLANTGREAIAIDAHDAGVAAVATSTTSPLLVSLDDAYSVHVWHCQPVFARLHVLALRDRPSVFMLSPRSELLLCGYDDGAVVLTDLRDVVVGTTSVHTYEQDDENHFAMVSAGDFLDEKALVLTASVDAVVKVWDREKHLLRQLTLALAFTSLCFMNSAGDVMAGLANGIFIVPRDDVLPEKPPTAKHRKPRRPDGGSSYDSSAPMMHDVVIRTHSNSPHQHSAHRPLDTSSPYDDSPTAPAGCKLERTESALAQQSQQLSITAGTTWTKPRGALTTWLAFEDRSVATHEPPPVLRQLLPRAGAGATVASNVLPDTTELRAPVHPMRIQSRWQRRKEPLGQVLPLLASDDKDDDWRDQLMPSSPYRLLSTAAGTTAGTTSGLTMRQRHVRNKHHVPTSPLVLQTLHQSPRPRQQQLLTSPSSSVAAAAGSSTNQPDTAPGLGIGASLTTAAVAPLQYCKHQAPVPPKNKTPRKLWNAIGGEDRRLIVLQRNNNVQQL